MAQTASGEKFIAWGDRLFVAFELGWKGWKLAFTSVIGGKVWQVTIQPRNLIGLNEAVDKARRRLSVAAWCPVFSCYEAGREAFWLHRQLTALGIVNVVVDSSSIEVNRRARPSRTAVRRRRRFRETAERRLETDDSADRPAERQKGLTRKWIHHHS